MELSDTEEYTPNMDMDHSKCVRTLRPRVSQSPGKIVKNSEENNSSNVVGPESASHKTRKRKNITPTVVYSNPQSDSGMNSVIDSVISGNADSVRRQEERYRWSLKEKLVLCNAIKMYDLDLVKIHAVLPQKSIAEVKLYLEKLLEEENLCFDQLQSPPADIDLKMCGRPRRVVVHETDTEKTLADYKAPIEKWLHIISRKLGTKSDHSNLLVNIFKGLAEKAAPSKAERKTSVELGSSNKNYVVDFSHLYEYLRNLLNKQPGSNFSLTPCESLVILHLIRRLSNEVKSLDVSPQQNYLRKIAQEFATQEANGVLPPQNPVNGVDSSNDAQVDVYSLNPLEIPIPMLEPKSLNSPRKRRHV